MTELHFDREKVGLKSIEHWMDSDYFVGIAHGMEELSGSADNIRALPVDSVNATGKTTNDGTRNLRAEVKYFCGALEVLIFELSDGSAVLGSGTSSAVENFDETEEQAVVKFDFLTNELPSGGGK